MTIPTSSPPGRPARRARPRSRSAPGARGRTGTGGPVGVGSERRRPSSGNRVGDLADRLLGPGLVLGDRRLAPDRGRDGTTSRPEPGGGWPAARIRGGSDRRPAGGPMLRFGPGTLFLAPGTLMLIPGWRPCDGARRSRSGWASGTDRDARRSGRPGRSSSDRFSGLADLGHLDERLERAGAFDGLPSTLRITSPGTQAGVVGRAGRRPDAGDHRGAVEPRRSAVAASTGRIVTPEIGPADPAELGEVGGHPAGPAGGDGESHPLVAAAVGLDRRVDPDDLAPEVDQAGPPEFPGLIAASVWIRSSYRAMPIPRPLPLTIPAVTVPESPNGWPTARTQSPVSRASESPQSACDQARGVDRRAGPGRSWGHARTCLTGLSRPLLEGDDDPRVAPWTTWSLVKTRPRARVDHHARSARPRAEAGAIASRGPGRTGRPACRGAGRRRAGPADRPDRDHRGEDSPGRLAEARRQPLRPRPGPRPRPSRPASGRRGSGRPEQDQPSMPRRWTTDGTAGLLPDREC